jgi:hypothetical protein
LQRSFFAGALNRGICTRQDRPHCGLVLKLNHGADEKAGLASSEPKALLESRPSLPLHPQVWTLELELELTQTQMTPVRA